MTGHTFIFSNEMFRLLLFAVLCKYYKAQIKDQNSAEFCNKKKTVTELWKCFLRLAIQNEAEMDKQNSKL